MEWEALERISSVGLRVPGGHHGMAFPSSGKYMAATGSLQAAVPRGDCGKNYLQVVRTKSYWMRGGTLNPSWLVSF